MKNYLTLVVVMFFVLQIATAQVPQYIPWQAVVRDTSWNPLLNQSVSFRFTIHTGSSSGTTVYQETQSATTNQLGMVNLQIGSGTVVSGTFSGINWSSGSEYLQVEMDPTGGSSYTTMGTPQMMSVPYALYSGNGTSGATGSTGAAGTTGSQGTQGITGPTGSTGTAGTNGSNGTNGAIGLTGPTGSNGTSGAAGATGPTGATGSAGAAGATGTAGATGVQGAGYYATSTTSLTIASSGNTSTITTQSGLAYVVGARVRIFYQTTPADYMEGTVYSYSGTSMVITVTNSGGSGTFASWYISETGNVGATGAAGSTGPTGAAGATGAAGSNGSNGAVGATGAAGTNGSNGAVGPTGINGSTGAAGATGATGSATGIAWGLTGNTGNVWGTNWIGNNDSASLMIKDSGLIAGIIESKGNQTLSIGIRAAQNNTGAGNSAFGQYSFRYNTSGADNTSVGYQALYNNTTGSDNVGLGYQTLYSNATGTENTAIGLYALYTTTSSYNTAVGFEASFYTTTGESNTSVGAKALFDNTSGSNTAVGFYALGASTVPTSGDPAYNTSIGYEAGSSNTTGYDNTYLGTNAGNAAGGALYDYTAIGWDAGNSSAASNYVDIGSTSVTELRAEVTGITAYSDGRVKDNVKESIHGLDFINHLRPVSYTLNIHHQNQMLLGKADTIEWEGKYDGEKIVRSGFIAQEVESAAKAVNYNFTGLHTPNGPNDLYGLNYTEFVVPLVKAVQEQQSQMQEQQSRIDKLQKELDELKAKMK